MKTLEAHLLEAWHSGVSEHVLKVEFGPEGETRIVVSHEGSHATPCIGPVTFEVRGDHVNAPMPTFEFGEMAPIEGPALATKDDIDELRRLIEEATRASGSVR